MIKYKSLNLLKKKKTPHLLYNVFLEIQNQPTNT